MVSAELAPIPMLLATGAVQHHLVREGLRTQCGLVCETGEARDVSQFALLIGYGAGAINPYLAFESIRELLDEGAFLADGLTYDKAVANYLKACDKGLLKTMAKIGISTLQSYRGAQIFEAIGLDRSLVGRCFTGTSSRVSGVGYDVLAREAAIKHERAFAGDRYVYPELSTKPKPRERPVSRSLTTDADSTVPTVANSDSRSDPVVEKVRFPTNSFLPMANSPAPVGPL